MAFTRSKLKDLNLSEVTGVGDGILAVALERAADHVKAEWAALAKKNLTTTAADYIDGIEVGAAAIDEKGNPKITVVLDGVIPNMIEQGLGPSGVGSTGPFDMRTFILKNKISANIPFHFAGIAASSGGTEVVAKTMRTVATGSVATRAMQLRGKERLPAGLVPRMRPKNETTYNPATGEPIQRLAHKVDPLAGMRSGGSSWGITKGQTNKELITFRRISWAGKPWIHPGIWPRHLAKRLNISRAFADAFSEL